MDKRVAMRKAALYVAFLLAMGLFALDRTAAYLHRPTRTSTAVVIYTAEWCPYCRQLRTHLKANGVPAREYDVENSLQGGMGFWALRGKGVPICAIGPDVVYGFDLERINRSLIKLGYRIDALPDERRVQAGDGTAQTQGP
jgi:glutaredoxin